MTPNHGGSLRRARTAANRDALCQIMGYWLEPRRRTIPVDMAYSRVQTRAFGYGVFALEPLSQ